MTFTRKSGSTASQGKGSAENKLLAPARSLLDFEALFQSHWSRVCGILYRLVGDQAEAEDLALDTFLRLYRRPPGDDHNLGGWLYRVATNLGLNALRARRRRQRYEEEAGYMALDDNPAWDPAAILEHTQEREQVRLALSQMKDRSAELLILRSSGLSYAEIAAALGIAPGSVGTLLARAEHEFEQQYQSFESH
jgi:RNA polymerase sigma-70 factor (ECF subfamily)